MKIRASVKDDLLRVVYACAGLYCLGGALRYVLSRHPFGWWLRVADIAFMLLLSFICFCLIYDRPALELTEEGVYVRRLFKKRFFGWDEFIQAGILRRLDWRLRKTNDLVLVQPGGSARGDSDLAFLIRNFGRIIHIPCKDRALLYTVHHYGELDFNFADGVQEY